MSTTTLDLETDLPTYPTEKERRMAWLSKRRLHATGTDIAAILGLSKFASPIDVYLDKMGLAERHESDDFLFGHLFERPILTAYSIKMEIPLEFADSYSLLTMPDFPLIGATLDARRLNSDRRPVDAKNIRWKEEEWGESGTDVFPQYYACQLSAQMMVTDTETADLAVCFSGHDFAQYSMHRDREIDDLIKEEVERWWTKHIIGNEPPDPDGSEAYTSYLKTRFRRATEVIASATDEVKEWATALRSAKDAVKAAESLQSLNEQRIKAYMGEASSVPGVATWRNNKDSEATDWHAAFESFWLEYAPQHGLDDRDKLAHVAAFTTSKPGPRVFRLAK
jgi:putative phage-type endonuclease